MCPRVCVYDVPPCLNDIGIPHARQPTATSIVPCSGESLRSRSLSITLFGLVRLHVPGNGLQLLQSLQIELLIPPIWLAGQLPQFVRLSNNVYFGWSSHANRIGRAS